MDQLEALQNIGQRLKDSVADHNTFPDGFWYNALTILSLVLSGFASVAATYTDYSTWVSAASAVAALCIALERALGFGARWRFHTEMKNAYRTLQDGIDFYSALPDGRKEAFLNDWWARLIALRNREGQIPNSGGSEQK